MDKVIGIIRHVITLGGGVLVTLGLTDAAAAADLSNQVATIAGSAAIVVSIVASVVAKLKDFSFASIFGGGGSDDAAK